ncbi:hypothetical protein T07_11542 [Trichinella nelsoni]|uniref:Uncharacterized protein n=1 Tax=Trichinella nelsoni TaxID=6336 RepID=A0A0V0SDE1_9BILA|nr:hypothetical protein T07_11542 [Trichinella nelsoni]
MNLELRRYSGGSLPANGPKQHSVQPAPVQKQSSDIYLNATLVEEKKFHSEQNFNRQLMMFIEFVEYFIRRVVMWVIVFTTDYDKQNNSREESESESEGERTGPIRTVVVRQKATIDKLAIVGIRNETLKWKRDVEFCAKIKLPKDCVIYAFLERVKTNNNDDDSGGNF